MKTIWTVSLFLELQNKYVLKHYFLKDINPVIRFYILSDTVFISADDLPVPIVVRFAVTG